MSSIEREEAVRYMIIEVERITGLKAKDISLDLYNQSVRSRNFKWQNISHKFGKTVHQYK